VRSVLDGLADIPDLEDIGQSRRRMHVNLKEVKRRGFKTIFAASVLCAIFLSGCSHAPPEKSAEQAPSSIPAASPTPPASAPAEDQRPVIVAFGDSLTAGVVTHSYPEYLQQMLDENHYRYRVDNQGVSGDTTTDGLARIGNVISAKPALVLLEFGGNDGLRGTPVSATKTNLETMVKQLQSAGLRVALLGITLPPNYGPDYVRSFTAIFPAVAKEFKISLYPFLLVNTYQHSNLMQPDGIHPNDEGNRIVAQDVFSFIKLKLEAEPAVHP
jgi:acyl-CoA thioesterase I